MGEKSIERLGALQKAVIGIVWSLGECTVHQVIEQMPRRKKPAYTTILTVMQKLEKSGWLTHRQDGRSYIYKPTRSREELGSRSIRQTIRQLFQGDVRTFMQHLIEGEHLTDKELLEMREMIDRHRKK
jgi:BlaI family transcriptional regulator, penicillinase repressor